jgi:hypothetical protein
MRHSARCVGTSSLARRLKHSLTSGAFVPSPAPPHNCEGESAPMTLGQALAAKVRLIVWCKACGHRAEPDAKQVEQNGADTTVLVGRVCCAARPAAPARWISSSAERGDEGARMARAVAPGGGLVAVSASEWPAGGVGCNARQRTALAGDGTGRPGGDDRRRRGAKGGPIPK